MAISEETIAGLRIDAGEVHVWTANLVGLQTYLTSAEGILNSRRAFCRSSGALSDTQEMGLAPILTTRLLFGALIFLSGTGVAPFIYTLF